MTKIYVACLASYNNGKLVGQWVDVEGMDKFDIDEAIQKMLEKSPIENAEEWAIHDYDGFGTLASHLGEHPDLEEIAELAELIEKHGECLTTEVYGHCSSVDETKEKLEEHYQGEYDSLEDWAEEFLEDTGSLQEIPENLRYYFDFAAYARDCELGGDIFTVKCGGKVHVFNNY